MWQFGVPNAPCGVERNLKVNFSLFNKHLFLMHRVELKEEYATEEHFEFLKFLMHRVELKE